MDIIYRKLAQATEADETYRDLLHTLPVGKYFTVKQIYDEANQPYSDGVGMGPSAPPFRDIVLEVAQRRAGGSVPTRRLSRVFGKMKDVVIAQRNSTYLWGRKKLKMWMWQ